MKETLYRSVKLADGLMQMHLTVKMNATAITAQAANEVKFAPNCQTPNKAGFSTTDKFYSNSHSDASTTHSASSEPGSPLNIARAEVEEQFVASMPPKAPRLR